MLLIIFCEFLLTLLLQCLYVQYSHGTLVKLIVSISICSALTPYYNEPVLFSIKELQEENEDGVSTLFYLQKIYPGREETIFHCPDVAYECLCLLFTSGFYYILLCICM